MPINIKKVDDHGSLKRFLNLPWKLYKDDPFWIPPLRLDLKQRLDRKKNSFFRRGDAQFFLAMKNREVVGRISASIEGGKEGKEGNFGFYDAVDDIEVSKALIDAAISWLESRNIQKVIGPYQFRLEDPYPGFLAEGHNEHPYFMMAYSKPYYVQHMEAAGFETAMDLFSYEVSRERPLPDGMLERAKEAEGIDGLKVRTIRMSEIHDEAEKIRTIFNEALKDNWGFVPFSESMVRKMVKDLKMLADPRIIFIAEVDGEPAGAVINLPNYNEIFADVNGRLFPKGLYRVWFCKKRIKSLRGYALAVANKYRGKGLACLLVRESFRFGIEAGYERGEVTWILGSNNSMNDMATFMGGNKNKAYRLYRKYL